MERRITDRCLSCGQFVGHYPVGFYCDTHCARCVCAQCSGSREAPAGPILNRTAVQA